MEKISAIEIERYGAMECWINKNIPIPYYSLIQRQGCPVDRSSGTGLGIELPITEVVQLG